MRRGIKPFLLGGLLVFLSSGIPQGAHAAQAPDYKEVYDLIRTNLAGINDEELNRAAVEGLVSALRPKVSLGADGAKEQGESAGPVVTRSNLFDNGIAYVRVGRVAEGLPQAVREAFRRVQGTNKPVGIVLDLRFAGGEDYAAVAETADIFLSKEKPLLDWGKGLVRSKEKPDALNHPVAVLVNRETTGASEALAAVLREASVGLILGNRTAGQAMIAREFPLSNGQSLRIATVPVKLGDGEAISAEGVVPDITVAVSPQDERTYFADAFTMIPKTNALLAGGLSPTNQPGGTNRNRRARFNEAELVRERREGPVPEGETVGRREEEPEKPVVHDPALARALDVLKGLAVVRHSRS